MPHLHSLSWAYLNGVIRDYNIDLIKKNISINPVVPLPRIQITNRYWYNEMLNYKYYMLPGILVILVTAIGFLLAGLNMVREKEIGTIEQINVTPVRKYQFIIAKMVPFLIIGLIDLALGLVIGKLAFNIPFEGSILLYVSWQFNFSDCSFGISTFHFNLFRDTAAIYVCCFFLYDNFYPHERYFHSLRKYANVGTGFQSDKSCCLSDAYKQNGNAKRINNI